MLTYRKEQQQYETTERVIHWPCSRGTQTWGRYGVGVLWDLPDLVDLQKCGTREGQQSTSFTGHAPEVRKLGVGVCDNEVQVLGDLADLVDLHKLW